MRKLTMIFVVLMAALSARAITDYATLEMKARRFFDQQEWSSAAAMYDLMLDQRPSEASVYGRAIVVAAVRGDSVAQMELMRKSMVNRVPFDSTFQAVKEVSFELGRTNLYERFLIMTRDEQPWMARTIDSYLMKYYTFRRDPAMMVKYSRIMLEGLPDNIDFLTTLAQGQMEGGEPDAAMATYRRIMEIDPANYNALLEIGNYGAMRWDSLSADDRASTLDALRRAYAIKPTPYVESTLARLSPPHNQK